MTGFLSQFEDGAAPPDAPPATAAPPAAPPAVPQDAPARPPGPPAAPAGAVRPLAPRGGGIEAVEHHVEPDRGRRRRLAARWAAAAGALAALALAAALFWHFSRLVEVPDLTGGTLAAAQAFCREGGLVPEVAEVYSLEAEGGTVTAQGIAPGQTATRGSRLPLTVSKGADPAEPIALPDFSSLTRAEAERWIRERRADNLRLVLEFSDSVAADGFLRLEFRAEGAGAGSYRRRDYATVYYSKGPESFPRNIAVPDFAGKPRGEAESWAAANGVELSVAESESDGVAQGLVMGQSVPAGEKVARRDALAVVVSLGRALVVPDFSRHAPESAASAAEGQIPVAVESRYHASVPYGRLVSQSAPAGARMLPGGVQKVTVVYSLGRPYLKDFRGMSEGDLPQAFFSDYTAKGASVTYAVTYVDSSEPKGQVVGMSDYSRFVPLEFHVTISVSKGNLPPPEKPPEKQG
jgi:serine/threonine-protein kinase